MSERPVFGHFAHRVSAAGQYPVPQNGVGRTANSASRRCSDVVARVERTDRGQVAPRHGTEVRGGQRGDVDLDVGRLVRSDRAAAGDLPTCRSSRGTSGRRPDRHRRVDGTVRSLARAPRRRRGCAPTGRRGAAGSRTRGSRASPGEPARRPVGSRPPTARSDRCRARYRHSSTSTSIDEPHRSWTLPAPTGFVANDSSQSTS